MILYEFPLHERVRTYLRLEQLFKRLATLSARLEAIDHHFALISMFEILDVAARADLKTDLLRDLDRQRNLLEGYRGNPAIAEAVLEETLGQIDLSYTNLGNLNGKAGQALIDHDWLASIRSRIAIPAGTCEFDLPSYHAWQQRDADERRQDILRWSEPLKTLNDTIPPVKMIMSWCKV